MTFNRAEGGDSLVRQHKSKSVRQPGQFLLPAGNHFGGLILPADLDV